MRYPLPWFPLSGDPSQCSCRTTVNCRPCRSFLLGCRFGRSGNSGFAVGFRRLRLSNRGLVLKARKNLGRYRYRYTFRPSGLPARGGCRPKRSRFHPLLHCLPHSVFGAPSAQGVVDVRPSFFRAVFFEDFGLNQLVVQVVEIVLHFAVGQLAVDQVAGAVVAVAAFDRGLA